MKTKFTTYFTDKMHYVSGSKIFELILERIDGKFKHVFHLNNLSSLYYNARYRDLNNEQFDVDAVLIDDSLYHKFLNELKRRKAWNIQKKLNNDKFYTKLYESILDGSTKVILCFSKTGIYQSSKYTYVPQNTFYTVNMYPWCIEYLNKHPLYKNIRPETSLFDGIQIIYASRKKDNDAKIAEYLQKHHYIMYSKLYEYDLIAKLMNNISVINSYEEPFFRVRFATGYHYGFLNYEVKVTKNEPWVMFPRTYHEALHRLLDRSLYLQELEYQRDVMSTYCNEYEKQKVLDFLCSL